MSKPVIAHILNNEFQSAFSRLMLDESGRPRAFRLTISRLLRKHQDYCSSVLKDWEKDRIAACEKHANKDAEGKAIMIPANEETGEGEHYDIPVEGLQALHSELVEASQEPLDDQPKPIFISAIDVAVQMTPADVSLLVEAGILCDD